MPLLLALLLALLSLTPADAFAQEARASCMALSGRELKVCVEQRAADQAAQISAAREEIKACTQACADDTPTPTPAPAARKGYSVATRWLICQEGRDELCTGEWGDDTSRYLEHIENRYRCSEFAPDIDLQLAQQGHPSQCPQPVLTPGPTGPIGPTGATGAKGDTVVGPKGDAGKDGRPAEITALVGVVGLHSREWSIVGASAGLRVGGRLSDKLSLGGYATGFAAGANDLGFGVGGYTAFVVTPRIVLGASAGWGEFGADLHTDGAAWVAQAIQAQARLEIRPYKAWVVGADLGAHFGVNNPALVWGVQTGLHF